MIVPIWCLRNEQAGGLGGGHGLGHDLRKSISRMIVTHHCHQQTLSQGLTHRHEVTQVHQVYHFVMVHLYCSCMIAEANTILRNHLFSTTGKVPLPSSPRSVLRDSQRCLICLVTNITLLGADVPKYCLPIIVACFQLKLRQTNHTQFVFSS